MSNIINYVRPSAGQSRKDINKILELITDFVAPNVEEGGAQQRITVTPHVRKYSTSVQFGGVDWPIAELRDRETFSFRRKVPNSPDSYPLVHTTNGSGLTFPVKDTKFGGRMDFDGASHITIANDPVLDPTDKLSIAMWLYIPANSAFRFLMAKDNVDGTWEILLTDSSNVLRAEFDTSGGSNLIDYNYIINTWFHLVVTWAGAPDNRMRLYVDKVQQGGDKTTSGTLDTSTEPLGIGSRPNGNVFIISGTRIAHLSLLHDEVNQTWIDKHFDGLMNTDDTDADGFKEILTIPFIGDESPQPNATAGLCST